jgi:hypothetical protein
MNRFLPIVYLLSAIAASGADIMPSTNSFDWSYAGVQGGIPHRTAIFQTLSSTATASQIQTALNNCPSNQVVLLNPGTYSLSSTLRMNRDGITLRGSTNAAGEPTTILNFNVAGGWALIDISKIGYLADNGWPVTPRSISSLLGRGTNSATLSSVSGLSVGQMIVFDQVEDGTNVNIADSVEQGNWGRPGGRYYMQFCKVTGINGTAVTFTPPLFGDYWSSNQTPQAYYYGTALSGTTVMSGVEDVKINRIGANGSHGVALGPGMNIWCRNVWSTQAALGHFRFAYSCFAEVRDSLGTLHDNYSAATYAFYTTMSTCVRIENNIVYDSPCVASMMSISGSVIAYNFATNIHVSLSYVVPECIMTHGGHNYANLIEGNFIPSFWMDFIHGSSSHMALVRNRFTGWEPNKTSQARPFNMQAHQDRHAALGNVMGTTSVQESYGDIFWYDDATSYSTFFRRGNYNTVTVGIPGEESLGGNTISNSYLYPSKPAFAGNRQWPIVDPTSPSTAVATNLPAGYRYYFGTWPVSASAPSRVRIRRL